MIRPAGFNLCLHCFENSIINHVICKSHLNSIARTHYNLIEKTLCSIPVPRTFSFNFFSPKFCFGDHNTSMFSFKWQFAEKMDLVFAFTNKYVKEIKEIVIALKENAETFERAVLEVRAKFYVSKTAADESKR